MATKSEAKKSSAKKLLIVLIILLIGAAAAYFVFTRFYQDSGHPQNELPQVGLKEEIVIFAYQQLPALYAELVRLNDEILLIDNEINRLKQIGEEFPRQKKIIAAEKSVWVKTSKNLSKSLAKMEKHIETIYVSYLVNKDKAKELIENGNDELITSVNEALDASHALTRRLKVEKPKGFIEKIKTKFLGPVQK